MNVFDVLREKLTAEKTNNPSLMSQAEFWRNGIDDAIKIVNQVEQQYNNGWIPADQPPKNDEPVLLSFENFTTPLVGRYEEDEKGNGNYYVGDEDETFLSQGIFVNAWQPLPAPFREDMQQVKWTNGDKIRAM